MIALIGTLLLATIPAERFARDAASVIESNDVYDGYGRMTLRQIIAWDESEEGDCVRFWRAQKDDSFHVEYDHARRVWRMRWIDDGVPREVVAPSYWESAASWDREVENRSVYPVERRRKLRSQ